MTRVLITGAGGFGGHHMLECVLATTDWQVTAVDSIPLRHSGRPADRIVQVLRDHPDWSGRVNVVRCDLSNQCDLRVLRHLAGEADYIVSYASGADVALSIREPVPFMRNNTGIAMAVLELARVIKPQRVIWVSTAEVFGPMETRHPYPEWDREIPQSPYAASKVAQEALCIAWWRTYGVPVTIVGTQNLVGERQDPLKLVPTVIRSVLNGTPLILQGSPDALATRHYTHARDLADGILFLLRQPPEEAPPRPERYNIASPAATDNLTLARMIARSVPGDLTVEFKGGYSSARPGYDQHYGLNTAKIMALGWEAPEPFAESLARTVAFTLRHPEWLGESMTEKKVTPAVEARGGDKPDWRSARPGEPLPEIPPDPAVTQEDLPVVYEGDGEEAS